MASVSSFLQRLKQDLKNDLIAGLLVIIPLATTIWLSITIASWVIDLLTRIPKQLNPFHNLDPILSNFINLAVGLTVPLLAILLIGLMARNIVGRWLLDVGEKILQSIPLAGSVYKTLQQILETLFKDSKTKFRRVVMVEYPRQGVWSLGFVTGTLSSQLQSELAKPMLNIFIPTTPNPTSGWYAIVPEDEVIDVSMSIEDAFKILISGGIVNPNPPPSIPLTLPKFYTNNSLTKSLSEEKHQSIEEPVLNKED
ncbi:DUF502 domain-containing protein [Gloeothece verrucosa]|uniref:Transporter n=1 Tax=Gloeothece verrucosa (strain PCC 7822) TaxID=497965 RepID=E0UIM7_GLOV7|nr:DUF502 domain-containing protein [Gloeothece verrucosa]ADN12221.1 protein of unknown function DUF502 [Gloeothece verrucosa PCC 7822]